MARHATYGPYDTPPPSQPPSDAPEGPSWRADTDPAPSSSAPEVTEGSLRADVVAAMARLLRIRGRTPECDAIFADAAPCYVEKSASGKHWCGITALYALRQAGLTGAQWIDGRGFIGSELGWTTTRDPKPGDVFYTERAQHHAIVERVWTTDSGVVMVDTIDGNSGPTPGVVARRSRRLDKRRCFYYPIAKLIAARLAAEPIRSVLP